MGASSGPPRPRDLLRGVLLVPERELFVARLDGTVVGSAHLVRPPRNNEAQAFAAHLMHSYIAPYARGHGLATMLTVGVEERARDLGYHLLILTCGRHRKQRSDFIEFADYIRWGVHPEYASVRGKLRRGVHYYKGLRPRRDRVA